VREIHAMRTMLISRRRACLSRTGPVAIAILAIVLPACGSVAARTADASEATEEDARQTAQDAASGEAGTSTIDATATGPVLVQQATASTAAASTVSATLTNPTTVGNLLVVVGATPEGPLKSVTGGGAATWMLATFSATNANMEIWYGVVTASSSTPVEIVYGGSKALEMRLNVTEWSGLATTQGVLDAESSQAGKTTSASAPAITTNAADLIVFAAVATAPTGSFTDPSNGPWTGMTPITLSGSWTQSSWYQTLPASTAFQPMVAVPGTAWDASIAAFKIAP